MFAQTLKYFNSSFYVFQARNDFASTRRHIKRNLYSKQYVKNMIGVFLFTCEIMETRPVSYALKHFQSNNCVNDDYKHDKKCNMKEWYHCHQYSVQNDLETYHEIKRC